MKSTLAELERQLRGLKAQEARVVAEINTAVRHLTLGSAAPMAGLDLEQPLEPSPRRRAAAARPKTRNISPAARARLSQLAKARWAKAKKEGKTKLG